MKPSQEFIKGKHRIGNIGSDFLTRLGDKEFGEKSMPTFQVLSQDMTDAEIERELNPGICDHGDMLTFLDNAPKEFLDGRACIFYFPSFVVTVYWSVSGGGWIIDVGLRGFYKWSASRRVLSPANNSWAFRYSKSSDSFTLESAIALVKKEGYKVTKEF